MFKSEERGKKGKTEKITLICSFPFNKSLGTAIFLSMQCGLEIFSAKKVKDIFVHQP